jgi:2,3-bisphosphoglycerate-independent phosphoglycerate mutase
MGNSEVGHLNIGAGRVVAQELTRIDAAIAEGSFAANAVLRQAMEAAVHTNKAVHLCGLVSDGGVHSELRHLIALIDLAASCGVTQLFIHALLDGRDTAPTSAPGYLRQLEDKLAAYPLPAAEARIATIMGRYWGMDRDRRWERTQRAVRALVSGEGSRVDEAVSALKACYAQGQTDEFIKPLIVKTPVPLADGDTFIFFNFRPDRARQLTRALSDPAFECFSRERTVDLNFVCLTTYDQSFSLPVAFPKERVPETLADVLAQHGLRQLHIAETEKYAHVTFFLNGGVEEPKTGERRILIPSPKVATYDLCPAMSAVEVTDALLRALEGGEAEVYIVNYANGDMVGHTGIMAAAIQAVETVDTQLGRLVDAVLAQGGSLLITADHGNAEQMSAPASERATPHTAHTLNPVPLLVVGTDVQALSGGRLADLAPTLLGLLGIKAPKIWTGSDLVVN